MRKIILILFFFNCVAYAWGQSATALFAQAKLERDPQTQIKLLNRVIDKLPKMADAYHYRADAYRVLGRHKQALDDYTRTIKLRPKDPFRYYARGLAYMDTQHYTHALADFNEAISLKPAYKRFYLDRARARLKLGKYEQAISDYEKGRRVSDPNSILEMMPAYMGAYRYDQALRLLDKSPQADSAQAHYWRGRISLARNELDESVSSLSKAINRDHNFSQAYRYRANAFKEMGDLEAALSDYTSLLALQTDALYYNRRGLVYEELGQFDRAQDDYSKAIELNSKWAIPYNNRGFVRIHLKDWEGAKKDLKTAISLDDTVPTPYINLAGMYWLSKKDRKQVYANLDHALRRNFKDVESLYKEEKKGWMFKGINQTAQFRALLYK
ncbi:MAG: tetratricopeptide repeat protein [Elusimicrobiaceae bacterium]|nr:tetratricopeptide repeat protein [Elusimicrobiaceae bacterium]